MWVGVIEIGAVVAVMTLLTIDIYLPGGLIEGTHDLATAHTAGFTVLVLAHLFNAFNGPDEDATYFPAQRSAALNQRQTFAICKLSCNRARYVRQRTDRDPQEAQDGET